MMGNGSSLRVLLVTPPYHSGVVESAGVWMPLGFVSLAGSLRARGHEVTIYDAMSLYHTHAQIRKTIEDLRPNVVALTAITASIVDSVRVCDTAKEVDSRIVTVLGNVHPTFQWREILQGDPSVDVVVRGEGEQSLPDLCDALAARASLAKVQGIAYRDGGHPTTTGRSPLLPDLDVLPMAWDLIDWPIYTYRPRRGSTLAVVSSSRGCQQQCSFCSQQLYWRRSFRGLSPERFVQHLEHLRAEYGITVAMLSDETPTTDRARWERILELLVERDVGVELLMETRVDDILRDEDILPLYRRAGVSHIYVGVEATIQDTLDTFKKEISVEQSRRAIELINAHEMVSETSFVLGMPDETPERIRQTVELAKHYGPDMAFFLAITPWPYAQLYPSLKPYIEVHDYSRYNLVEPIIKPEAMTLSEVADQLVWASHEFFSDKMRRLDSLSPEKRTFMVSVMRILANHSYLADHMKGIAGEMPPEAQRMMAAMDALEASDGVVDRDAVSAQAAPFTQ